MADRRAEWALPGACGEDILGVTDAADGARASVVLLHGHKGYYDYGFLPVLADRLVRALPVAVHRYNASHSGMTRRVETFEKPELFARDTWNHQVHDLRAVIAAARAGRLPGAEPGLPVIAAGHSRGGTASLLAAGRHPDAVDGLISMASPSYGCSQRDEKRRMFDEHGRIESPSGRTGQALWIDPVWLDEQDADPAAHDVLGLAATIAVPALIVHGDEDPTIDVSCGRRIAGALPGAELAVIAGGDHVFNTPNPAELSGAQSPQLEAVVDAVVGFVGRITPGGP